MANLGDMVVRIVGDATGFNKSLNAAQKKLLAFGINATAVITTVNLLGKAFVKTITDVAEYGSAIDDASMRTGLSREAIQEYKYVAEQVGTTLEAVTGAVGMMTRGLDTNKERFKELGVQLKNSDGSFRSTTEIFNDTIEKLSQMTDETERDKLAFQVLGRSAQSLLPIFKQGAGGLQALKDEAHDLGIVLSDEAIINSDALGDSLLALKSSMRGLGQAIVADITPALNNLVRGFTDFIENVLQARQQIEAMERAEKVQPKTLNEVNLALAGVNARLEEEYAIKKRRADEGFDTIVQDKEIARLRALQGELKNTQKELILIEKNKTKPDAPAVKIVETPEEIEASKKKLEEYFALLHEQRIGFEAAADDRLAQEAEIDAAIKRGYEERKRLLDEEKRQRTEAYTYIYGQLDSVLDGIYSNEIARIEQSELSEEEKARKIAIIKRKQAIWDKAQGIADVAIQTAIAVTKALPNVFLAAVIGALGAAQAAVIASTPLPEIPAFATGGIVQPQPGGTLATVAEAGVAEAIIPLDRLDAMLANGGGGTTHLVVNIDSRPILDQIFDATRNGTVLISSGAVV